MHLGQVVNSSYICTDILTRSVENIVVHTQYRRMLMKKGVNKEEKYFSWARENVYMHQNIILILIKA